jgi:hypothetical protein
LKRWFTGKSGEREMGIYVGTRENAKPEVFVSKRKPTKETRPEYDVIYGPFKTTEEAQEYINTMQGLGCGSG